MVYLKGRVLYRGTSYLILEQSGVGYKLVLPESIAQDIPDEATLYLHEAVREDGRELFAFKTIGQLELFWKLIAISGVGPKSAQKIVYADAVDRVKANIMAGDVAALTQVPGIGKKTAQKIILELKGALAEDSGIFSHNAEAVDALVGLGYARRDAEAALSQIVEGDTESRIRAALKRLGR